MSKFQVDITLPDGSSVETKVVESADSISAIEEVLREFKAKVQASESQSWNLKVKQVK
ncbi:MAG: hypothetical protein Q8O82_07810 [Pseudorhodobacter sp.]|nr:hypothetical protein [Pseudorhodobacter sp.]